MSIFTDCCQHSSVDIFHITITKGCTKPVLYLSANMRSVLLPADTKAGTVIYRLRASDADDQYPISFGVVGENINTDGIGPSLLIANKASTYIITQYKCLRNRGISSQASFGIAPGKSR